ncbi:MAG: divergent polysaccharide deacetylase family protein [Hydrogenimonas sp.]|nr:MAG: divergent polysaccharide deacetylase family protein [Hydrogenimonas sp.]
MMTKRKPTSHRKPTSSSKKSAQSKWRSYLLFGLIGFFILSLFAGMAGFIGYEIAREKVSRDYYDQISAYRHEIDVLEDRVRILSMKLDEKAEQSTDRSFKVIPPTIHYPTASDHTQDRDRPKLAIIIDDVSFPSHVRAIRALPLHVTPSFFPPTKRHPKTPELAQQLQHYMIHLPMEAMHYNHPEDRTLTVTSSEAEMADMMDQLRDWFPRAHFINNHTGSRFTADRPSMEKFYHVAKRYGFVFIDSRTTAKTVVPALMRSYQEPYIARDVFLDNKADVNYIHTQLKKAVQIARTKGYAIAIAHPRRMTFKALASAQPILKGVDVVYIDELYKKIR